MPTHTTNAAVPDVPTMPPLNLVITKKRIREVSVQSTVPSDAEQDGRDDVKENVTQQEMAVSALNFGVPLSRKQRRKHLRSVSKQSNTQVQELQEEAQKQTPPHSSSRVPSASTLSEDEPPSESDYTAEAASQNTIVPGDSPVRVTSKPDNAVRPQSPWQTETAGELSPTTVPLRRPVLKTAWSSPTPLPQTITYAAALVGSTDAQASGSDFEVDAAKERIENDTPVEGSPAQLDYDNQEESDIMASPQEFKRKKRIRVRRRKSRQSVSESTVPSREDDCRTPANTAATTPASDGSPAKQYRTRQQSLTSSITDTLIEEVNTSYEDEAGPSIAETNNSKNRSRGGRRPVENNSPVTPKYCSQRKGEAIRTSVVSEKHKSFIDTIRDMLTYDGQQKERKIPSPPPAEIISPIPQRYISTPKILIESPLHDVTSRLQDIVLEAGPQTAPLMPRNWAEARTWDMSPPVHGTKKVYTNLTQRQAEEERSAEPSRALTVQKYTPLPVPPFRTLWTVSRYLELKQKMMSEHRKEEGRRWAIMKAVEKNLDFQKRRGDPRWPHNWNTPVVKDRAYMEKMIGRVNFLMRRPE